MAVHQRPKMVESPTSIVTFVYHFCEKYCNIARIMHEGEFIILYHFRSSKCAFSLSVSLSLSLSLSDSPSASLLRSLSSLQVLTLLLRQPPPPPSQRLRFLPAPLGRVAADGSQAPWSPSCDASRNDDDDDEASPASSSSRDAMCGGRADCRGNSRLVMCGGRADCRGNSRENMWWGKK